MKTPIVVIGAGEMGSVFARGFLRIGHPVYPVTRAIPVADIAVQIPEPELVLLAVAEKDLHAALQEVLTRRTFDSKALIASMVKAFEGDQEHKRMGRSAPARLQRALALADNLKPDLPMLRSIAAA